MNRVGSDRDALTEDEEGLPDLHCLSAIAAVTAAPSPANTVPTAMSIQKWFAVASRENQTQSGYRTKSTLRSALRTSSASVRPMIRACAACRLGIAAYG